jgi:D-alanyl-D-alanine carboxypeptidase
MSYEDQVLGALRELNVPASYLAQRRWLLQHECADLVSIGLDRFGREQRLERRAAGVWQAMVEAANNDGIVLLAISGFRSFDYQRKIIERKLASGLTIDRIICVNAPPGFSEHHTGRAIDIGTPGSPPVTEEFEQTLAFDWLTRRAGEFGFRMTYPKNNVFGVIYEPWHWMFPAER